MKGHFPIFAIAVRLRLALAITACGTATTLAAQTVRIVPVAPQINIGASLAISATPANVSFTLVQGGVAAASTPITITTKASNLTVLGSLSLYAYFSSSAALTSAEGSTISASNVIATSDAQPNPQSFTGNTPFATGSGVVVYQTSSILAITLGQGHQNTLSLSIDLSTAQQQPAGVYVGTLILQAQAL